MKALIIFFVLSITFSLYAQKFDGLALPTPMGWNTWNTFTDKIDEQLIREAADAIVSSGMKDVGYV